MTTPIAPISLLDIKNEFGGVTPISLSRYYAGGTYVGNPAQTSIYQIASPGQSSAIVPTFGTIGLGNFRGITSYLVNVIDDGSNIGNWIHSNNVGYSD